MTRERKSSGGASTTLMQLALVLRRDFLAFAAALGIATGPAAADDLSFGDRRDSGSRAAQPLSFTPQVSLPENNSPPPPSVENFTTYLRGIDTLVATFSQENADGTMSSGTLYIDRPFRARLAYDPPSPALIIANSGQVAVFDRKSNAGPSIYPLRRTPFYAILTRNADLSDPKYLIGLHVSGNTSEIHLRSRPNNAKAVVKLIFTNEPISLTGWTVIDEFGNRVAVTLRNTLLGPELAPVIFDIELEAESQAKR